MDRPIDISSETWHRVRAECEALNNDAVSRLCAPGTDQATTEYLRGRVSALRDVLRLAQPRPTATKMAGPSAY